MRVISYLFVSLALTNVVAEVAAQAARPLPPILAHDGQPFPQTPASINDAPAGGVPRENILFAEDFESQTVGVKTDDFPNWTRVSAGATQACSITEIIASGGPKSGRAYRAFLEDSGSCGRAEIKVTHPGAADLTATYVGKLPVPVYADAAWDDQFIYKTNQAANCTGTCLPDQVGYMYSVTLVKMKDSGDDAHTWQNIRPTGNHSENPPFTNSANPNFPVRTGSNAISTSVKRNQSLGYTEVGANTGNASWTILTAAGIGEPTLEGLTFDIYMIFRPDSRSDAEGGNGEAMFYIERAGVEPATPRLALSLSTIGPGKYQYESGSGAGPEIGQFSLGVYNAFWANNDISSLDSVEVRVDNVMVVKNPNITEMYNTMQLTNFSSLGW